MSGESPLMKFKEAGEWLQLHPNTIRQRKGGTDLLTHVPGFGRNVFLIRAEVMDLVNRRIEAAQAMERKRQKHLHLVSRAI
jgi:hypothetical protein